MCRLRAAAVTECIAQEETREKGPQRLYAAAAAAQKR